ncbi:hypothetical protein XENORESO_017972, partial [Xenotaenia resolanae]
SILHLHGPCCLQDILKHVSKREFEELMFADQLTRERQKRKAFFNFKEEKITFPPTYRYERGSRDCYLWQKYKTSGVRVNVPSWCDRILWKSYPETHIICTAYGVCHHEHDIIRLCDENKSMALVFLISSNKEDSSPDSNLTLESDSSGVFLSLSNQSQEDAGSDSDQPISGSELGSSNTSLEKDGDDGGLKEWGREESSELQWCYPSLLNTPSFEDVDGCDIEVESGCGEAGLDRDEIETASVKKTPTEQNVVPYNDPQTEEPPPRKKVTLMGVDPPLPLSPSKQQIRHLLDPYQKPLRSSGLDCGDVDPFVQSDSFVYLAVSARPPSKGEAAAVKDISIHDAKQDDVQKQPESIKAHPGQPTMEPDTKLAHLAPQKPEEGDFLCTDSFVYLAAPACLLLGPTGTASYSGKYV